MPSSETATPASLPGSNTMAGKCATCWPAAYACGESASGDFSRGRLSLVVRAGADYDTIDVPAASARGINVSTCPGKNSHRRCLGLNLSGLVCIPLVYGRSGVFLVGGMLLALEAESSRISPESEARIQGDHHEHSEHDESKAAR